ncbi:MAG: type I-E CRISPR-associated protein Cse2/CasB [Candidatus Latescibacterota bacterium]
MRGRDEHARAFITWLQEHAEDRGVMAELRRGLVPETEWRAWKHLARWCDLARPEQRLAHATVGGAFAAHPDDTADGNLGDTLRSIAVECSSAGAEPLSSFEGRFRRLLTCESVAELAERVGAVVRAAAQRGIALNYVQLLHDLLAFSWPESRERAKLRWAASFWGSAVEPRDTEEDA